jgi:hypothetical protein
MNYRNPKLLKLAEYSPCMMCSILDGTIVAAHSNQLRDGKGTGIKAHDHRIAFLCHQCHHMIDNDKSLDKHDRIAAWEEAHRKTIGWLFTNEYLQIK